MLILSTDKKNVEEMEAEKNLFTALLLRIAGACRAYIRSKTS
jgi:hypothetical protein